MYNSQEIDEETHLPIHMNRVMMGLIEHYTYSIHGSTLSAQGHFFVRWVPPREECFQMMQLPPMHITRRMRFAIELIKPFLLDTGELVCVLYTYCIRIIQRKWRKQYQARRQRAKQMSNPRIFARRLMYGNVW